MNFVIIDIGLESFPPLLFAALRFGRQKPSDGLEPSTPRGTPRLRGSSECQDDEGRRQWAASRKQQEVDDYWIEVMRPGLHGPHLLFMDEFV